MTERREEMSEEPAEDVPEVKPQQEPSEVPQILKRHNLVVTAKVGRVNRSDR